MKVSCEVNIYEENGKDACLEDQKLSVRSHWNCSDRVVLEYKGINITVLAEELKKAIANSSNWRVW